MKIFGFILLGLLAFLVTVVFKFPAAGVLPHVNTNPLQLKGVSGSVWKGSAQEATIAGAELPLDRVDNVNWVVQPQALLSGRAGAKLDFELLGGRGEGVVKANRVGDVIINDGLLNIPAASLEQFLPLPLAKFGGVINADIEELELENNLLKRTIAKLTWRNSEIISQMIGDTKLGMLVIDIVPEGEQHIASINNTDGDIDIEGQVSLDQAGNYRADIKLKPTAKTPPELSNRLSAFGRPESDGTYRIRNNGNINNYI